MVSALGLDTITSCAAARAGIRRSSDVDDVHVYDEEAEALVPVVAHRVPIVSKGLYGFARRLQLAISAVQDLRRTSPTANERPVGLILVLGSEWHRTVWLERLRQDPGLSNDEIDVAAAERELSTHRQRLRDALMHNLVDRAKITTEPHAQRTILGDQTGFIAALEQATAWLANGTCETCWVGGVDSYLDPPTLQALMGLGLLRTPSHPVGFMPGELACFLTLERPKRQPGEVKAEIGTFVQSDGAPGRLDGAAPNAGPLMQAMSTAGAGQNMGVGVVNLNGDSTRALEWGNALIRRKAQGFVDGAPTWVPPLYFGEIGAATGPASVAILAQGWARGYAPAANALVCLMEDGAARGAFSVTGS
jgi:3-oxoacyl-[acyl-carrier-protein] synthase-1